MEYVIPEKSYEQLCDLGSKAEKITGYRLEIISGGSTGALNLLYDGQVPKKSIISE